MAGGVAPLLEIGAVTAARIDLARRNVINVTRRYTKSARRFTKENDTSFPNPISAGRITNVALIASGAGFSRRERPGKHTVSPGALGTARSYEISPVCVRRTLVNRPAGLRSADGYIIPFREPSCRLREPSCPIDNFPACQTESGDRPCRRRRCRSPVPSFVT